ncbi:MAG TPA: 50S ribosomal protein L1 [Fibrobacteres bacterium]|jgi:large subunit ribosomal protein L1|nr:50S ribosomal protein L1 [Fibrobacterota bacterium]
MKRSKTYRAIAEKIQPGKEYDLGEAIKILKNNGTYKIDNTLEVHMNLGVDPKHSDQVVRGNVALPHGSGKKVRILAFAKGELEKAAKDSGADFVGAEEMVQKILEGWTDFDAVVATPDMMPLISKVARVLGPRGLMPSPKAGTVTANVSQIIKELKAGKISYRVDKGSNIHAPVGKLSFTAEQLKENAMVVIDSVAKAKPSTAKGVYVKSITLAGTMTPGVRVDRSIVN